MQRSIIFKYFTICLALVLLSIAVLGAGIMAFATMYFKDESYQQLEACAQKGSQQITSALDGEDRLNPDLIGAASVEFELSGNGLSGRAVSGALQYRGPAHL